MEKAVRWEEHWVPFKNFGDCIEMLGGWNLGIALV